MQDIDEFVEKIKANADQMYVYAVALKQEAERITPATDRRAASATLCAVEQCVEQIKFCVKETNSARHDAALILGADELIGNQHKTLDQFAEEAVADFKKTVSEAGATVELKLGPNAGPVLTEAKRRLEEA